MHATLMYGAGDVRVQDVPDSVVKLPTDALVRVTASCVCGSDLWPYDSMAPTERPARMGHEFIGIVEDTGPEVATLARGDLVVSPFAISDGTCEFCREGLQTSCAHPQAGFWDEQPLEGRAGRRDPGPARRRHPGQAAGRAGRGPYPVPADALGRPRDRPPRRHHQPGRRPSVRGRAGRLGQPLPPQHPAGRRRRQSAPTPRS